MSARPPLGSESSVTLERLEDQIRWYDAKSTRNQCWFKWLRVLIVVAAACVPLLSLEWVPRLVPAGLGALIVVLEALQQINQFHANWIAYRSTCEALKHEKFLFLGGAAHYASAAFPEKLLAERIESLVSQEHAQWASTQEKAALPAKGQ